MISLNTMYQVLFVQFPPNGIGENVFSIVFDVNCLSYTTYIEFNDCIVSQTLNLHPHHKSLERKLIWPTT